MLKWLQTLTKTTQRIIYIGAILVSLLSFCLIIASIAHDGYNEFAKAFYIYNKQAINDPRWDEFLEYSKSAKLDPSIVSKIKEIYGGVFYTETEEQNALGFGFFIATMTLLFALCLTITSSLSYVSIGLIKYNIHTAYRENMIPEHEFTTLCNILESIEAKKHNKKKEEIQMLDQAILEAEAGDENNPLEFFNLNKKPLTARSKKIMVILIVFCIILLFTLLMLIIPFKDGSTLEIFINEFKTEKWNSANIAKFISGVSVWIFIAWNLTLKISQTLLHRKYKKMITQSLIEHGDLTLTKEEIKEKKSEMLKQLTKNEAKIDKFINLLVDALAKTAQRVDANTLFQIREILQSLSLKDKDKKKEVTNLLKSIGVDTDTKEVKNIINTI
ncbi:hypothetical protein [Mycoplasma seminis]|uniref:Uncharacterized protein n=1 Tax=Mycoplasma seminis TaxID=512749 RepID=A0ABY9H9M7_9MOLU|nr:hypothetical protein [Mycoplasma seminis]WLP85277.1 hypothetical protein Q8852_03060 [Mycoplasma seminis]